MVDPVADAAESAQAIEAYLADGGVIEAFMPDDPCAAVQTLAPGARSWRRGQPGSDDGDVRTIERLFFSGYAAYDVVAVPKGYVLRWHLAAGRRVRQGDVDGRGPGPSYRRPSWGEPPVQGDCTWWTSVT
jgi:hypothetical protein